MDNPYYHCRMSGLEVSSSGVGVGLSAAEISNKLVHETHSNMGTHIYDPTPTHHDAYKRYKHSYKQAKKLSKLLSRGKYSRKYSKKLSKYARLSAKRHAAAALRRKLTKLSAKSAARRKLSRMHKLRKLSKRYYL